MQGETTRFMHRKVYLKLVIYPFFLGLMVSCAIFSKSSAPPLEVVDYVDLNRYVGTWYEIARFPMYFERNCVGVTATYTLREDGKIDVLNKCRYKTFDGKEKSAKGIAWVADEKTNAKLKVRFFWPFSSDYWIIDLDENYEFAVVGEPRRKYLWILSRTPTMDKEIFDGIIARIMQHHYDPARFIITPQKEEE